MKTAIACSGILMLMSCNGVFDEIYDKPIEIIPAKGQIVVDATSWTDWYYIDLQELQRPTGSRSRTAGLSPCTGTTCVPMAERSTKRRSHQWTSSRNRVRRLPM